MGYICFFVFLDGVTGAVCAKLVFYADENLSSTSFLPNTVVFYDKERLYACVINCLSGASETIIVS